MGCRRASEGRSLARNLVAGLRVPRVVGILAAARIAVRDTVAGRMAVMARADTAQAPARPALRNGLYYSPLAPATSDSLMALGMAPVISSSPMALGMVPAAPGTPLFLRPMGCF